LVYFLALCLRALELVNFEFICFILPSAIFLYFFPTEPAAILIHWSFSLLISSQAWTHRILWNGGWEATQGWEGKHRKEGKLLSSSYHIPKTSLRSRGSTFLHFSFLLLGGFLHYASLFSASLNHHRHYYNYGHAGQWWMGGGSGPPSRSVVYGAK
jgi:hypothetical protein